MTLAAPASCLRVVGDLFHGLEVILPDGLYNLSIGHTETVADDLKILFLHFLAAVIGDGDLQAPPSP